MLFIGICGASGSGKTTLATELCRAAGVSSTVLPQDAYYLIIRTLPMKNVDASIMMNHPYLTMICSLSDVSALMNGQCTTKKRAMIFQSMRAVIRLILFTLQMC